MQAKKDYPIVLGDSITAEEKRKLLLRYSFLPQSLDYRKDAVMTVETKTNSVELQFYDSFDESGTKSFSGSYKDASTDEYILVFQKDHFVLERVGGVVNGLTVDSNAKEF
ncbi:hypothetical protein BLSTO_02372 [Blastocystis sp. subtype 1]